MRANDVTRERLRSITDHRPPDGKVLSLYIDLDPREFGTQSARSSAITSVLDAAHREAESLELDHEAETALRADIQRLRDQLSSPSDLPTEGAEGLAIFASGPADLLEVLRLPRPVPSRAVIKDTAFLVPIADLVEDERWLVVLVSRGTARFFLGSPEQLKEGPAEHLDEYEREVEFERHLRGVAERIGRSLRDHGWDCLLVGGPHEQLKPFLGLLGDQERRRLVGTFDADVEHISAEEVMRHAGDAQRQRDQQRLDALLDRFEAGLASGGRATSGTADTMLALEERRVEALLLDRNVEDDEAVSLALAQDASVHRIDPVDVPRFAGHEIGAVLRF